MEATEKTLIKQQAQQELLVVFDLDGDDKIDADDLRTLILDWGAPRNPKSDINGDGQVDLTDFNLMLSNFE